VFFGSNGTIVAMTLFVFSGMSFDCVGKKSWFSSFGTCECIFVDCKFAFSCRRWPLAVAMVSSKCFVTSDFVSPGHDKKLPFLIACRNADFFGLKQEACKYCANSSFVLLFVIIIFAV